MQWVYEQGLSVSSDELLSNKWDGFVPFPGPQDHGAPYRTAQLIMAILAKLSGWAGKSFWRLSSDPSAVEVQALEMKIAGFGYSLGVLGSARLVQV